MDKMSYGAEAVPTRDVINSEVMQKELCRTAARIQELIDSLSVRIAELGGEREALVALLGQPLGSFSPRAGGATAGTLGRPYPG